MSVVIDNVPSMTKEKENKKQHPGTWLSTNIYLARHGHGKS